jgi:protein PhnA
MLDPLNSRADHRCELCGATDDLDAYPVPPADDVDQHVLACGTCRGQLTDGSELDGKHWFCLQEAAWSEVPVVQVVAYRLLHRLDASWATELLEQLYLEDEVLAWANKGVSSDADTVGATVDSNGTVLSDGDTVTLIKDLVVKGANFTAKRGTVVKKIRLTDDPGLVEGRVNKVGIYLKTEFLKRA